MDPAIECTYREDKYARQTVRRLIALIKGECMDKQLKELLTTTTGMFFKYGIRSVTMDDIAREMGISKKTLYQYVENKEDLVKQAVDFEISNYDCFFEGLNKKSLSALEELVYLHEFVIKNIKESNASLEFDMQKYYPKIWKQIEKVRHERMYKFLVTNMEKGLQEEMYRNDIDPDIIARIFIARANTFLNNDLFSIEEMSQASFLDQIFSYHIHALCNMKGLAFYEQKIKKSNEKE
jgi:AcrR family transcriptional regulator